MAKRLIAGDKGNGNELCDLHMQLRIQNSVRIDVI